MSATLKVNRVELSSDSLSVVMHVQIMTGTVIPGMVVEIPFNNSFAMGCEIESVTQCDDEALLVIAAEDADEAEFVASFNTAGEILNVLAQ
jgi:hypothetical protein